MGKELRSRSMGRLISPRNLCLCLAAICMVYWTMGGFRLTAKENNSVNCGLGGHRASSCSSCPMDSQGVWKGAMLCTGECVWSGDAYMGVCRDAGDQGDSAF